MKLFKLKFMFCGLLATMILALVMTSCEQQTLITELEETATIERHYFAPPIGFDNKAEAEMNAYFENLTAEETAKLEDSYKVSSYLQSIDKLERVKASMAEGTYYVEVDLSRFLTATQLEVLTTYEVTTESDARCGNWSRWACYRNSPWCSNGRDLVIDRRWCGSGYQYTGYCSSCNIW